MTVSFIWLGHSGFLFNINGRYALIDPFITHNPLAPTTADEIGAELILITHGHGDHIGDSVTIAQRTGAVIIGTPEICKWCKANGAPSTWEGNTGGTYRGDFLNAKWTPAFHTSSLPDGSYGGQPMGFVIEAGGRRMYHAGDTGLFGDMRLIGEMRLDVAFLPIGDKYTMGLDDSITAIKMLNPRYVVPMHFNTFPAIAQDVVLWAQRVNNETNATPVVVDPGNFFTVD